MALAGAVLGIVGRVLDRIVPDKNARAEALEALQSMDKSGELDLLFGQLEVNKIEAAHPSVFVSGWRPAVGWVCVAGMGYNFVLFPLLRFAVVLMVPDAPELPLMDIGELMALLMGMLGLAGYRTYEKRNEVART